MAVKLHERGVPEPAASLAAEAGIAVFHVAFQRWVSEPGEPDLGQLIRDSLDEMKAVTAGKCASQAVAGGWFGREARDVSQ